MNEPLFQSLIRDLEQRKPIRERLAALRGEKLDALKRETEAAIARAPTESSPDRRKTYEKLRELMIDTTRDILLSSLLEATEGITRSGRPEEQPEPKAEQPRAQESAQPSASDQAPKESLNVFEKNPAPAATQKSAMGFREWVRSQRGQSAPAEGVWNKIVLWFDVQSPNPEQHYDENIWSKPKYWFAYGVYRLMDWWNGWGKNKSAVAPVSKPEDKPADKPVDKAAPATANPPPAAETRPPAANPGSAMPETAKTPPPKEALPIPPAQPSPTAPPGSGKPDTPSGAASSKPSEVIPSAVNLLDGNDQTVNAHRLSFSTDPSFLLKVDGKRYLADWNKISLDGGVLKEKAKSINYVNGEVTIIFQNGIQWKISAAELSSLTEKIANGAPEQRAWFNPKKYAVAPNSFLVKVSYLRIGVDGKQTNENVELRVQRLD